MWYFFLNLYFLNPSYIKDSHHPVLITHCMLRGWNSHNLAIINNRNFSFFLITWSSTLCESMNNKYCLSMKEYENDCFGDSNNITAKINSTKKWKSFKNNSYNFLQQIFSLLSIHKEIKKKYFAHKHLFLRN